MLFVALGKHSNSIDKRPLLCTILKNAFHTFHLHGKYPAYPHKYHISSQGDVCIHHPHGRSEPIAESSQYGDSIPRIESKEIFQMLAWASITFWMGLIMASDSSVKLPSSVRIGMSSTALIAFTRDRLAATTAFSSPLYCEKSVPLV